MVLRSPIPGSRDPGAGHCTFEDFLANLDENVWAEWVDGEIIPMTPASSFHQDIVRFLLSILSIFVETHDLGWVTTAPFTMYLPVPPQGREPDLLFVKRERMDRIRDAYLDGPADMVVEVVSLDSRTRDRVEKMAEYERAGVREYWLIDPLRLQADFYRLMADGGFTRVPVQDGVFTSEALPGFRLRVDWLWRKPLPKILEAAAELGLV